MARSDRVATLEEAKAQFETSLAAMAGVGGTAGNAVAPCAPLLLSLSYVRGSESNPADRRTGTPSQRSSWRLVRFGPVCTRVADPT